MIYYFSGTGNSKWIAEQLAATLNDQLISIADAVEKGEYRYHLAPGESIGWVFPIHSWGLPQIVVDFIAKWHIYDYQPSTYCYMACSCGDDVGLVVEQWRKALGGIQGNAAFAIQMPNNYICMKGFDVDSHDVEQQKLRAAEKRIKDVAFSIAERRSTVEVIKKRYSWIKSRLIYPMFISHISDKPFKCDTSLCTSCGLCVKRCPTHNIKLNQQHHPEWLGNCTQCLACIHSCPTRAINYGNATQNKGRYFHK